MNKQIFPRKLTNWGKKISYMSLLSFYTVFALDTGTTLAAPRAQLENWRFYPQAQQLEIVLSSPSQPRYFYLSQPPRIVVDLPDTKLGYVPTAQNFSGVIQRIRVSQFDANITRIVMDLAPGSLLNVNRLQLQPLSWENPTRWVLRPSSSINSNYSGGSNILPPGNISYPPNNYNLPPQPANLQPNPNNYNNYNNPQLPSPQLLSPSPKPSFSTLPPVNNNLSNTKQPFISVPSPGYINNSSEQLVLPNLPTNLPPARLPANPVNPGKLLPNIPQSSFPAPKRLDNQIDTGNQNDSEVIEFGQPFPDSLP